MLRTVKIWTIVLSSCLGLLSGHSVADSVSHSEARALREAGNILSLEDIINRAKTLKPGKVIDTDLDKDDDLYVYEIEILDDRGWVWEIEFDASNGELLELELDN